MHPGRLAWTAAALLVLLAPDRRVDVGGHVLRARVLGDASPTIVFEAALGEGLRSWEALLTPLAEQARVVAYDRAGIDQSEPSDATPTPVHIATELHALLSGLEVEPPYILVGHSAGGLSVRAFAARYPDEVAGLLLVDATPELLSQSMAALDAQGWAEEQAQIEAYYASPPSGGPAAWWQAAHREWRALRAILDSPDPGQAAGLPGTLPPVPSVVLTALQLDEQPGGLTRTAEGAEAWHALHAAWVAGHPEAAHVLTRRSGHHIQHDQPGLVLASLGELLRAVREDTPLDARPLRAAATAAPDDDSEDR